MRAREELVLRGEAEDLGLLAVRLSFALCGLRPHLFDGAAFTGFDALALGFFGDTVYLSVIEIRGDRYS